MTHTRIVLVGLFGVAGTALAQEPPPAPPAPPQSPEPAPAPPPPPPSQPPAAATEPAPPPPAPSAPVEVAAESESPPAKSGLLASAKLGGFVPFDGLSPFVSFGVEIGYALPVLDGRLAILLVVDYTEPTKTGTESDPRVTGGTYTWKLTEQELGIMPILEYRLLGMKPVVPYVGIGPRMLLARSTVRDNGSPTIMETHEQSTAWGVGVPVGAELPAGPGRVIGELLLQYGSLNHVATGDANTGAASLSVGYRITF